MPAVTFYTLLEHAIRLDLAKMEFQAISMRMASADKRNFKQFANRLSILQRDMLEEDTAHENPNNKDAISKLKELF